MRIVILFAFLLLVIGFGQAQSVTDKYPNIVVDPVRDSVFPQIASGGSWSTSITLFNLDTLPSKATLMFMNADGAVFLNIVGLQNPRSLVTLEIPVNGSVVIETGDSGPLQQGIGLLVQGRPLGNEGKIAGVAVFRQRIAGRPDFEAAVPLSPVTEKRFKLPFDHVNGYETGVAIVSWGTYSNGDMIMTPTPIIAEFWDESGNRIGTGSLALSPIGYTAFTLNQQFPELVGRRGVIEFRSSKSFMAGLGLRFSPGGSFTSVPTASLATWNPN